MVPAGNGVLTLAATTSIGPAVFASQAQDFSTLGGHRHSVFVPGVVLNPIAGVLRGLVSFNYARQTGETVAGTLSVDDPATFWGFQRLRGHRLRDGASVDAARSVR